MGLRQLQRKTRVNTCSKAGGENSEKGRGSGTGKWPARGDGRWVVERQRLRNDVGN